MGALGRLVQVASTGPRWSFAPAQGCATFPEVEVNVTGQPFKGPNSKARVRGFVDTHIHMGAFEFLGGRFHCGRPWSPYGVTVALRDCADHYPNGEGAVVENFLSTGSPTGTHSPEGWPSFAGWPRDESLTHEGTYWKWVERAWRSGVRLMVNDLVENRALCELYPLKQNSCNEMVSAYKQADDMHALQDYIDAQFGGPGKGFLRIVKSSAEARKVINAGKLAMVLGVEVSEVLDCGQTLGVAALHHRSNRRPARQAGVGRRAVVVPREQVRQCARRRALRLRHDRRGRQHRQQVRHGPVLEPPSIARTLTTTTTSSPARPASTASCCTRCSGRRSTQPLMQGQLPVYPPPPHCNPKGLTPLGEHLIRSMMRRGMIIETDHLSVKARQETLTILEAAGYPGVISSHSWGDAGSQKRIQRLGGLIGPISDEANDFAAEWREARAFRDPRFLFGIGFGSDINGLHAQPAPRSDAAQNPVRYPFRSVDGGSVIDRQRSGTRTYDINTDGVDHYGLYSDWIEDLRLVAGPQIAEDLANGAEAYLQLWARTEAAGGS